MLDNGLVLVVWVKRRRARSGARVFSCGELYDDRARPSDPNLILYMSGDGVIAEEACAGRHLPLGGRPRRQLDMWIVDVRCSLCYNDRRTSAGKAGENAYGYLCS